MWGTPSYVRDPDGLIHQIEKNPTLEGWMTLCQQLVLYSKKWKSCFPMEGMSTCLSCLAT